MLLSIITVKVHIGENYSLPVEEWIPELPRDPHIVSLLSSLSLYLLSVTVYEYYSKYYLLNPPLEQLYKIIFQSISTDEEDGEKFWINTCL